MRSRTGIEVVAIVTPQSGHVECEVNAEESGDWK